MNITDSSSHTAMWVRWPTTLALITYSALWIRIRKPRQTAAATGETDRPTTVSTTLQNRLPTMGIRPATKVSRISAGVYGSAMSKVGRTSSRNRAVSVVLNSAIQNCAATIWRKASPSSMTRRCSACVSGARGTRRGRTAASAPISRPT